MLKPLLARSGADRLAAPEPGRIDQRSLWTTLVATHSLPPDACPPGHALDIMTCTKTGVPGLLADHGHAWIRLVEPGGRYCSVGFFPDDSTGVEPDERPGLRMPGMLLSPDKYDRVGWHERGVRIHLTGPAHAALIAWIEDLQEGRSSGSLAFDLVDRSCVGFVVRAAARVGVAVEAEMAPSRFLIDALLRGRSGANRRGILRGLRQAGYNAVLAVLGGRAALSRQWRTGPQGGPVSGSVSGIEPLFAGWREVLHKPVPFYHVRPLRDWQGRIAAAGIRLEGLPGPAPEQHCDAQPPDRPDPHAAGAGGDLDQRMVAE